MNPIGEYMSKEVATSKSLIRIAILSFFLGFLISVAEPDLLILGSQVEGASGGTMGATIIVYMVSIGVGILISLAVLRLLRDRPQYNTFMAITYAVIFVLAIFVSEEFLAIAFDASGATTGALTTPFVLAISLGLSKIKGGKNAEENSFGLVGAMSAGPILAVMLLSIISGQRNIQGTAEEYIFAKGVIGPIINTLPTIFVESLVALLPITILFFIFNFVKFKVPKVEILGIVKGLALTLVGLVIFLTAVNSGFMDMGRILGMQLAKMSPWILIGIGFVLGLIVVLVEPAVHVLGEQIEDVTAGHIPIKLIRMTLSIGVGTAIALSMVRIVVPEVKLWYFLLPGFVIAMLLSYRAEPVFVGIAYDAGGVASGPMTATFVLAFAQGAATVIDTADVLVDGFGVIAMVAMAPVLSLMVLGTVFRHKKVVYPTIEKKDIKKSYLTEEINIQHDCIMAVVNRGFAEKVVDVARGAGATGATIIHGRGTDEHQEVLLPIINIELQPEKEIIILITGAHVSETVADSLLGDLQLDQDGEIAVYVSPTEAMVKSHEEIKGDHVIVDGHDVEDGQDEK
jgi:nitrogen regulatory protein PII